MQKEHTQSPAIKVIAGRAISEYPSADEIRQQLRHFYHRTGEQGLECLLEALPHAVLIMVLLRAETILESWQGNAEQPPRSGCKEVAHG